ncbi:MAG: hypothetical protein M3487_02235, partial [Actinomycetota bacterium]|nr:hypothetical protein [Actinomycetota bacterium]
VQPVSCLTPIDAGGRLVDLVGCSGDASIHMLLPATPDSSLAWATSGWASSPVRPTVRPAAVAGPAGTRVVEIAADDGRTCVAVIVAGVAGWRESCRADGSAYGIVAGTPGAPILVEVDAAGAVDTVTAIKPDLVPLANGCRAEIGTLLAALAPTVAMTGLRCVGGAAIAGFDGALVQDGPAAGLALLRDAGDGTWPAGDTGTTLSCARYARTCAEFGAESDLGEALLAVPPRSVLVTFVPPELGSDLLDPVDVTARYSSIGAADVPALSAAVDAAWRADGDDVTRATPTAFARAPLVVTFTQVPDDSIGGAVLAVWYSNAGAGLRIDAVVEVGGCRRGVTTLDGALVCL